MEAIEFSIVQWRILFSGEKRQKRGSKCSAGTLKAKFQQMPLVLLRLSMQSITSLNTEHEKSLRPDQEKAIEDLHDGYYKLRDFARNT